MVSGMRLCKRRDMTSNQRCHATRSLSFEKTSLGGLGSVMARANATRTASANASSF